MLGVMTHTPRTRDRYRLAVAAVTGLTSVGAITATGWIAGAASADYKAELAQRADRERAVAKDRAQQQAKYEAELAAYEAAQGKPATAGRTQQVVDGAQPVIEKERSTETRDTVRYVPEVESGDVGSGGNVGSDPGTGGGTTPAPDPQPDPDPQPKPDPDPTPDPAPAPTPPPPPPPPSSGS
jgi:hypothetical protein